MVGARFAFHSLTLVDTLYGTDDVHAVQQLADWVQCGHDDVLGVVDRVRVVAFPSMDAFAAAVAADRDAYLAHCVVQIDASDVKPAAATAAAFACLADGGVYCRLENHQQKGAFAGGWYVFCRRLFFLFSRARSTDSLGPVLKISKSDQNLFSKSLVFGE